MRSKIKLVLIGLICVFLFLFRLHQVSYTSQLINLYESTITITGRISVEPSERELNKKITVEIDTISGENISDEIKIVGAESVIVTASKFSNFQIGDTVRVTGKLRRPENFDNENGLEFDYVNFLAKDRIFSLIYSGRIELVKSATGFGILRPLFKIKKIFLQKLSTILPSPQVELLGGLLLGVKQSLGAELEKDFRKVGLIHVVVLSGYNITIIIVAVFGLLASLPRALKYFFGVLFVILFALLVGLGSTVVRATIMSIIAISSKLSGRTYNVNRALFFAGIVMVLWNPLILFHDPSFQLSFLATLGLINLSPRVSEWLWFVPEKMGFREIVSSTVSTQIAVLPLILKMTGEISVIALPVNLIVLPLIPMTMLFGFITGVVAFIFWPVGFAIGFFAHLLLSFELWMVETFAVLSFSTVVIPAPGTFLTILFYCAIVIFFYYRPVQVFKKVRDILRLSARKIIGHK